MIVDAGKFGMPWHGRIGDDGAGDVIHLPNGQTRPWPYGLNAMYTPIKLRAADAQPATTTPTEAADGQQWRDYLLWQYRRSDIYHDDLIGASFLGSLVIAAWFWMPASGTVYEIIVTRPTSTQYRFYAVHRATGAQTLMTTLSHSANYRISDIADGPGDRALFIDVNSVYEIVLTIDEQGAIVLSEALLQTVGGANSSSSDTSFIPRKVVNIINTFSGTEICSGDGKPHDLFTHTGTVEEVDPSQPNPSEYYEEWDSVNLQYKKIKYQNKTTQSLSEAVLAALYIDGVASVLSMRTQTITSKQWTFNLEFAFESHDVLNPIFCSSSQVIDTPYFITDTMIYDYTGSLDQEILVNGTAVSAFTSSVSIHAQHVKTSDTPYNINRERWQYDGLNKIIPYTDADYTIDGVMSVGNWSPTGTTIANNSIWTQRPRILHPIWIDGTNGVCIHPGGISSIAYTGSEKVNYNPNTGNIEIESSNFSYV